MRFSLPEAEARLREAGVRWLGSRECNQMRLSVRDGDRHVRCHGRADFAQSKLDRLIVARRFRSSPEEVLRFGSLTRLLISPTFLFTF